jgi:hypothetical protein
VQFENHHGIVIQSAELSREESAASLQAANRFLADRPGFGMTMGGVVLAQIAPLPILLKRAKSPCRSQRDAPASATYGVYLKLLKSMYSVIPVVAVPPQLDESVPHRLCCRRRSGPQSIARDRLLRGPEANLISSECGHCGSLGLMTGARTRLARRALVGSCPQL